MSHASKGVRLLGPVAIGLTAIVMLTGCGRFNGTDASASVPAPSASASATPNPDPTDPPISDEMKVLLDASRAPKDACLSIVSSKLGESAVVNGVYTLSIPPAMVGPLPGDLKVKEGDPAALQWSDALNLPLLGSTPEEVRDNLYFEICTKPLVGTSLRHLFANLTLPDGTAIIDLQTNDEDDVNWLDAGDVPEEEISVQAGEYVPLLFASDNLSEEDEEELYNLSATKAREYADLGDYLLHMVSHYELGTLDSLDSRHSYHLVGGGLAVGVVPEVEITTKLDNRLALWFYLTEKTECAPISLLGFNLGDTRPMLTDVDLTCEALTPPPVSPPPATGCPDGQFWDGDECLESKVKRNDVAPPAGVDQQGPGTPTDGNGGTGGTGNVVGNGSTGQDTGTNVQVGGTNNGGNTGTNNETANGGNTGGATNTEQGSDKEEPETEVIGPPAG